MNTVYVHSPFYADKNGKDIYTIRKWSDDSEPDEILFRDCTTLDEAKRFVDNLAHGYSVYEAAQKLLDYRRWRDDPKRPAWR